MEKTMQDRVERWAGTRREKLFEQSVVFYTFFLKKYTYICGVYTYEIYIYIHTYIWPC